MKSRTTLVAAVAVLVAGAVAGTVAIAGGGKEIREKLTGYEETPLALSTSGEGKFEARIDRHAQSISYRLSYRNLEAKVTQAHIHFGAEGQTGGISVFLCSNLGNGPAGTQPCPDQPATITGTIVPKDVIGPTAQGIDPGEFGELVDAIRAGVAYANVHSEKYPGGEIRAQFEEDDDHGHHFDKDDHRGHHDRGHHDDDED
jgi:CHRD domain-containing protein